MDKELTAHQRGVILRGICNGAALKNKQTLITEDNTVIVCNAPLLLSDICCISSDAEAFGMKVELKNEGFSKIVFSRKEEK